MSKLGVAIGISPSFGTGQEGGGISYLLFDDFLSALTAGNVDGTDAEPTGGARDVTDAENGVISISSEVLNYIPQSSIEGWGNYVIKYTELGLTRTRGTVFLVKITRNTVGGDFMLGFDNESSESGFPVEMSLWFSGGGLLVYDTGSFGVHGTSTTGIHYLGILVSDVSAFFYMKFPGETIWRLIRRGSLSTASNLIPKFSMYSNATTGIDWVKIPEDVYLPVPVYSSGFSESNAASVISDSGSNGYDMVSYNAYLNGSYARFAKPNNFNPSSGIGFLSGSGIVSNSVLENERMSVFIQYRISSATITYGGLFYLEKATGGHYITIRNEQSGGTSIYVNTSSFFNVGAGISPFSSGIGSWHGIGITIDADAGGSGEVVSFQDGTKFTTATGISGTSNTSSWLANSTTGFASGGSTGLGKFGGDIRHAILTLNGVVATEAQALVITDPDTVLTTALLDGYFGAGNYAWYKMDDLPTSDGLGHAETSGLGAGGNGVSLTGLYSNQTSAYTRCLPSYSNSTNLLGTDGNMDGTYDDESGGGGGTVNIPPGWNSYNLETDGTDTVDKDTGNFQTGTASCKITVDAANEGIVYPITGLTAGKWYEFVAVPKVISGTYKLEVSTLSAGDRSREGAAGAWLPYVVRFLAAGTSVDLRIVSSSAASFYVDNASFAECDVTSFLSGNSYGTDLYCEVEVTTNSEEGCGLFAFCDSLSSPTEMAYALIDSIANNISLIEMVAGVSTIKATTAISYAAGKKLTLVTNDTSGEVRCYYDTTLIGSFTRNAALAGNSYAGIISCSPEPTFDNLIIYDTTSADATLSTYE